MKCSLSSVYGKVCANLLNVLEYDEIMEIMRKKEFNLDILSHGLSYRGEIGRALPSSSSSSEEKGRTALFLASRDTLMSHVSALVESLPRPLAVFNPGFWPASPVETRYSHKMEATFQAEDFRYG